MIVAVHSYKGGTGKTFLSSNLATTLALKGKKTCLLDMDFRAPSLNSLLKTKQPEYWLNDYLNGACCAEDMLQNLRSEEILKEKLFVGFANPSTQAIRDIVSKDRKWEMQALSRMFSLRDSLIDGLGFEYLILDTSPGLQHSSINAVVVADIALVVATLDEVDMDGTKLLLHDLYKQFKKKTAIVLNKVPDGLVHSQRTRRAQETLGESRAIFCECNACSCDLPLSEDPCFFVCRKQNHLFSKTLDKIALKLIAYSVKN